MNRPTEIATVHGGRRIAIIGGLVNLVLAGVKAVAGLLGKSNALLADAAESMGDVASSLIVLSGIAIAAKPADATHPYGHGKAERLHL